ncbi:MAG: hypothetical protein KMY50_03075 [Candidatus Desulforudis sp.]|nr:hypothetical protein [Desulforudis sp.]
MILIPKEGTRFPAERVPEYLEKLSSTGYLRFSCFRVTTCKGRNTVNIGDRLAGCNYEIVSPNLYFESIECSNCGNEYSYEELEPRSEKVCELTAINYDKIVSAIVDSIRETDFGIHEIAGYYGNYVLELDSKRFLLVFDGSVFDRRAILTAQDSGSHIVRIALDEDVAGDLPANILTLSGIDIIYKGFQNQKYILRDLPSTTEIIQRMEMVVIVEREMLELTGRIDWRVFEGKITDYLLHQLRNRVTERYQYSQLLKAIPSYGNVSVSWSGPGKPDKITLNLAEYLDELLSEGFTTDAKCYGEKSRIDHNTIEKVQHHLSLDEFGAQKVLIITTTNNITCWQDVANYKRRTGHYKLVILSARLLAEVVVHLAFADEFLKVLKECTKQ